MAADIEKLASAAKRAFEAPGREEDAMPTEEEDPAMPELLPPARPPCLWAGESPDRVPCGDAPEPAPWMKMLGERAGALPHPAFACTEGVDGAPCDACAGCTARVTPASSTKRPITIGDIFGRLAGRAGCFQTRDACSKAFLNIDFQQMGVAVEGGLNALVLDMECELRSNVSMRALSMDIRNMFNELCRVAMQEDLLDSLELLGVDLSWWSVFIDSAYSQTFKSWFWVEGQAATGKKTDQVRPAWADGTLKAAGVWRAVKASIATS